MIFDFESYLMFMFSLSGFVITLALLVIMSVKTPMMIFFKAFISGKPIIQAWRRDRKVHFTLGDYVAGMTTSDQYGTFIVDPNSVATERKSGASILPVNAEIGLTMDKKILAIISGLKGMGIENIEEAEKMDANWFRCNKCEVEGVILPKNLEDMQDESKNPKGELKPVYECPQCKSDKSLVKEHMKINVPTQTFNFYDLIRYFKYYMSSSLMMSTIERKVRDELSKTKQFPFKAFGIFVGVGIMIFMCAIAFMIITQQIGSSEQVVRYVYENATTIGGLFG